MKVIIVKIALEKQSMYGGKYTRVFFKDSHGQNFFLDVYINHFLSKKWLPYIKKQAVFDNVRVYRNNIIDGSSSFIYLGQNNKLKNK